MSTSELSNAFEELEDEYNDLMSELSRHGDEEGDIEQIEKTIDSVQGRLEELRYLINGDMFSN